MSGDIITLGEVMSPQLEKDKPPAYEQPPVPPPRASIRTGNRRTSAAPTYRTRAESFNTMEVSSPTYRVPSLSFLPDLAWQRRDRKATPAGARSPPILRTNLDSNEKY